MRPRLNLVISVSKGIVAYRESHSKRNFMRPIEEKAIRRRLFFQSREALHGKVSVELIEFASSLDREIAEFRKRCKTA